MEAKSTVLTREQINHVWKSIKLGCFIPDFANYGETHPEYKLLVHQAEISFKAGIKEAADFLESIGMNDGIMNCFEPDKWRVFLNDKDRGGKK